MILSLRSILATLVLTAAVACGGDDAPAGVGNDGATVGGSCESDGDCATSCAQDGDFPGGLCTQSCAASDDCPDGTVCIEKDDGTCVLECEAASDCRSGWQCGSEDLAGSEASARVCIAD